MKAMIKSLRATLWRDINTALPTTKVVRLRVHLRRGKFSRAVPAGSRTQSARSIPAKASTPSLPVSGKALAATGDRLDSGI